MESVKPLKEFEYICKSEKKKQRPTKFILIGLTSIQALELGVILTNSGDSSGTLFALKEGLKGWKNFDAKFSKNSDDNINTLPMTVIGELATAIMEASTVSETERKN